MLKDQFNERMENLTDKFLDVVSFGYKNRKGKQYLKDYYYNGNATASNTIDGNGVNDAHKSSSSWTKKKGKARFPTLKRFKINKGERSIREETSNIDDDASYSSIGGMSTQTV